MWNSKGNTVVVTKDDFNIDELTVEKERRLKKPPKIDMKTEKKGVKEMVSQFEKGRVWDRRTGGLSHKRALQQAEEFQHTNKG